MHSPNQASIYVCVSRQPSRLHFLRDRREVAGQRCLTKRARTPQECVYVSGEWTCMRKCMHVKISRGLWMKCSASKKGGAKRRFDVYTHTEDVCGRNQQCATSSLPLRLTPSSKMQKLSRTHIHDITRQEIHFDPDPAIMDPLATAGIPSTVKAPLKKRNAL